jgi:hypothetical protein
MQILDYLCSRREASAVTTLLRFPERKGTDRARKANWLDIHIGRVRQWFGRLLNNFGLPGAIRSMDYQDIVTGNHVAVSIGSLFVRVSINGRDYYFDRVTGKFDGTGTGCSC